MKRKGLGSINPLVMVIIIILIATALTYIIPGGTFDMVEDPETGKEIIDVDSFRYVPSKPTNPISIPVKIMEGCQKVAGMIILIGASAGAFEVITNTGTFHALIGKLLKRYGNKQKQALWILTIFFGILGNCVPVQVFIPFCGTCIVIALALGYDDFTGSAMLIISTACAAHAMPLQSVIVAVQTELGLPAFSGIIYRFIALAVFLIFSTWYLVRYAEKVRNNPTASVVYGLGEERDAYIRSLKTAAYPELRTTHIVIVIELVIAFILMIYGGLAWGWRDFEIAGTMLVLGIVAGWTNKSSINNTAKVYATGVKNLTNTYLIMGLASAVATILKSAGNVETIIYGLSQGLSNVPLWIIPVFMFIIVCIINIFVPSGTGKIPMLMPILGPVARHVGMSQQMVTYCYAFGDSIANYLLPYQSALAGFLESGRIPFARYMKFMWKLLVIWFVLAAAQLIIFQQCNIGPF